LNRRFLIASLATTLEGGLFWWNRNWIPTRQELNSCLAPSLPVELRNHPVEVLRWCAQHGGDDPAAQVIFKLQEYNLLLFDLVLKRNLRWQGQRFPASIF